MQQNQSFRPMKQNQLHMKHLYLFSAYIIAMMLLGINSASAQEKKTTIVAVATPTDTTTTPQTKQYNQWFAGVQVGGGIAYGDDDLDDFGKANGVNFSAYVGKQLSREVSLRLRFRYMNLNDRANDEVVKALPNDYPNDGYYGYKAWALQGEAMLNLSNIFLKHRKHEVLNLYAIVGAGINSAGGYDKIVEKWKNLPEGAYSVDTKRHTMALFTVGPMFEVKASKHFSLHAEMMFTLTGDELEGVKSDELYDAYLTYACGLTWHF